MPIGSFESAWEDYDHTDGPALREEAKVVNKVGAAAPNWRLVIGTENFTRRLQTCEVTFSKEGDSSIRFTVAANLRALQYERARVSFWFGYGTKLVPYFRGRLAEPVGTESGINGEASAYGLSTQLGQRYFQNRADYGGMDLRAAVADIIDRFGVDTDRIDFWGTHTTELANDISRFGYEVSLLEGLQTVLEPMQFKTCDIPGGMFIIKRGHLADMGTDEVFSGAGHYEPEDYPKYGFTFDQSQANFFSKVVAFRYSEKHAGGGGPGVMGANPDEPDSDDYAVFATENVADPGPFTVNEGRVYPVPDYPGQQEHAEREAGLLATALSRGVGQFTWRCHPIDFGIGDHFTVIRHEQIHDPAAFGDRAMFYLPQIDAVSYACVAEEITFTLTAKGSPGETTGAERWVMNVTGEAFEKERETIRDAEGPTAIDLVVPPDELEDIDTPVDFEYVVVGDDFVTVDGDRVVVSP